MSILGEFKAFISKGNVMDLAVGVIIGGAFSSIVSSLVKDVIMPAIGMLGAAPDFSQIAIGAHQVIKNGVAVMGADGKPLLEGGIMIGNFLNNVVSFLILAAVVFFFIVKPMTVLMAKAMKPNPPAEDIVLLREIRDSLKKPAV